MPVPRARPSVPHILPRPGGTRDRAPSAQPAGAARCGQPRRVSVLSPGGCGEVIGADSGCGPEPAPGTRRGRRPGRGPQSCGSASSTRKALPAGAARQCPRPGARDSGTAGPNLPAAARPAPAAAPHSPLQHGRPRSAGNTAQFRFRSVATPIALTAGGRPRPPRGAPPSATPPSTPERGVRGNGGPGRVRQGAPRGRLRRAEAAPFPGNRPRVAGSGADSGAMSGRAGRRRLVLHVDLNNTVVAADAVSGQGPREALNVFLSTATWGREGADGEWQWMSDRPSLRAPCPGAISYYCRYGRNQAFTESGPGQRFSSLHAQNLQLLEWPGEPHQELSVQDGHGKHYHFVLPSFFRLLEALHRDGRDFTIVFRTFGTDLPRMLLALRSALAGQHPQFPALQDLALPVVLTPGQIRCSKREVVLKRGAERLTTREDGRKLYDYFSSLEGIGGFQDHFDWWARNQFSSQGGKPLWIDPHDPSIHHIFIDDNIRLDDDDTIVHPQVFSERGSSSPRCAPTSELYDVCLVQTNLLEAIANEDYFLHCVRRCEENYDSYLAHMESGSLSQQCDGQ